MARPEIGSRVLAFHPEARAWRPATVKGYAGEDTARVHFPGYWVDDGSGQAGGPSEFDVKVPEEIEPLESAADFFAAPGEPERARAWRGILQSLAVVDPRVYGERRAAAELEPQGLAREDVYPLLVASMLDADARIPGGAALFVRMRHVLKGCDPEALARTSDTDIGRALRLMPSPLRARVLFTNARRFLELDRGPDGFRGWLAREPDPVAALCQAFDRLEPRAAVLFLRYLGYEAIAPDEALVRVGQRLGWLRRRPPPPAAEVRDVWMELARLVEDRPSLLDLTVRRFADAVCRVEPRCSTCAVPACPSRRAETDVPLWEG
jgi:endonuclease III